LKSSISSIVPMEPRKDWSGMYSRVYISASFYSLSGDRGGLPDPRSASHRGSLQSLLKLSPCVPQLGSTIEDEPLGPR
jgi:hypothetical protein